MNEYSETLLRVRYAETDKMGYVYYGNYFIYFEVARAELIRQRGVAYRNIELEDDRFLVVAECNARYRKPARYDDPLRIRTQVADFRPRVIRFSYEVFHNDTGDLLVTGETVHVVCDSQGRPRSLPEKYHHYFDGAVPAKRSVR